MSRLPPHVPWSETSREAASAMRNVVTAQKDQAEALFMAAGRRGLTRDELWVQMSTHVRSIDPIIQMLHVYEAKLIVPMVGGKVLTRPALHSNRRQQRHVHRDTLLVRRNRKCQCGTCIRNRHECNHSCPHCCRTPKEQA